MLAKSANNRWANRYSLALLARHIPIRRHPCQRDSHLTKLFLAGRARKSRFGRQCKNYLLSPCHESPMFNL